MIPGRNATGTLGACLASVRPLLEDGILHEIVCVDDGSTDGTREVARSYGARVISRPAGGPGAARNTGWRAATTDLVWFMDADCVADRTSLAALCSHLKEPEVGGAGGSYRNLLEYSRLAALIHQEIRARHRAMPREVAFLGGFNVLYRRALLAALEGFDEHCFNGPGAPGAEDIDLSYRAAAAGWVLRFEPSSVVGHHHPTRLVSYLRVQGRHGYWRLNLHLSHRRQGLGDSYSSLWDNVQPALSLGVLALLPTLFLPDLAMLAPIVALVLGALQIPMAMQIGRASNSVRAAVEFCALGFLRSFARGLGLAVGIMSALRRLVLEGRLNCARSSPNQTITRKGP